MKKKTQSIANKNKFLRSLFLFVMLLSLPVLTGVNVQAADANASQKAMKIAESQTQGKAVSTKFVQEGGREGYKVRILKDGKISHIFISLSQVQ